MRKFAPFVVDLLLVILFCGIGRRSHDESVLTGLLTTVWPFATGLVLGWGAAWALRGRIPFDSRAVWPTGVIIWAVTLAGGMLLRVLSGQGTAASFIVVAATVLAVFLLGWRAVRSLMSR